MIPNRKLSLNVSAQSGNFNQNEINPKSLPRHQELNAACDRNKKLTAETRRRRENSWTLINADRWYSHCAKYTHPSNKKIFPRRQEGTVLYCKEKAMKKKGALFS